MNRDLSEKARQQKMTIRRQQTETFDTEPDALSEIVRRLLNENPTYGPVIESEHGLKFETHIKTTLWVRGFYVTIGLFAKPPGTEVTVSTTSDPLVLYDPANIHNRHIRRLFQALRENGQLTLLRASSPPNNPSEVLLRPASGTVESDPQQLLRASASQDSPSE